MNLFDTHCHIDAAEFDADRDAVIARAYANGVSDIAVPGVTREGWPALLDLCSRETGLHPALGLHPVYLTSHRESDLIALRELAMQVHPIAIGEIGLDYVMPDLDRQAQQRYFDLQLEIAQELGLPVILHVRKAHDQVLLSLKRINVVGGIAHAFNGSVQQAKSYMALGFKLGFGGMLTYERSTKLRGLAHELPLESIVLETDAPDLTVAQHRGERNSPEYLPFVLNALAEVRDMDPQTLAEITTANAREVFGLSA
jgi:TatD DNase family protein